MLFDRAQVRPVGPTITWVAWAASAAILAAKASGGPRTTASIVVVGVPEVEFLLRRDRPPGQQIAAIQGVPPGHERIDCENRPVELRHHPRLAGIVGPSGSGPGRRDRGGGDGVGLDVVGMPVSAVGVVGDDDVRALPANDGDQRPDRLAFVGVDESLTAPLLGADHARVAPASRAAEIEGCADAQRLQRRGEFADAVAAQLVRTIDRELGPAIPDDLALLAERAGDDTHLRPAGGVVRDRGAVAEALVVGMCVDEQQPRSLRHGRTLPAADPVISVVCRTRRPK